MSALWTTGVAHAKRTPPLVMVSIVILAFAVLAVVFGAALFPDATKTDILGSLQPIGAPGHPLGTDQLGRDVLALSVRGAASSLGGPVVIALGAALIGVILGSIAGYWRGPFDFLASRATDLLLALPVVLVAIVVAGILGSGYWLTVILLVVLFSPSDFRIVRAAVIEQRPRPYIEAARIGETSPIRTLVVHVLPNVLPFVVANLLLNMAFAIVAMSSLSFLGLGVPDGTADWGRQLTDAQLVLSQNPAAMVAPALLIVVVASAINIVGDWLTARAGVDADAL